MQDKTWLQRLTENLDKLAGEKTRREVLEGCEALDSPDLEVRANWARGAMERLDRLLPDSEKRWNVVSDCACRCQDEFFDEFRDEYRQHHDIDRLIDKLYGRAFLVKPVREGNTIYITKAPRRPEEYARAKTPEEKRLYFCHCDNIRALKGDVSLTYCFCGAGWCQRIWEAILGRPVKVDIVKSVLQGDEICQFAVHLGGEH